MVDSSWRESIMIRLLRRSHLLTRATGIFAPSPAVSRIDRDIIYGRHGGEDLGLDVFVPLGEGAWPVVVMIHGGGFVAGDKSMLDYTCGVLASTGFLTFSIDYRLAPESPYPAHVDDCAVALQWVRDHGAEYGGDLSRLCVGGGSAGAYLAATLGVFSQNGTYSLQSNDTGDRGRAIDTAIDAVLLLNGVFDLETTEASDFPNAGSLVRLFLGDVFTEPDVRRAASPLHHVTAEFPCAFIGVGTRDSLRGESIAMARALSALGVEVESREYPESGHGWFNWHWTENSRAAHEHMVAWLREQLG